MQVRVLERDGGGEVDELAGGGDLVGVGETPTLLELRSGRKLGGVELAEEGLGIGGWHRQALGAGDGL